jgi:UDP-N-acetylmuramoyl-L-alanyl-D-glutamate--2,6-diaminopimelate ligase
VRVEADRARALALAIADAPADAVVLVAGKGHEAYQEVKGSRMPFSDVQHARTYLQQRFQQAARQ